MAILEVRFARIELSRDKCLSTTLQVSYLHVNLQKIKSGYALVDSTETCSGEVSANSQEAEFHVKPR